MSIRKMESIKERLYIYLILFLALITVVFTSLGLYLYYLGWLKPIEEKALFIGLVGTSLTLSVTLGLRMITDIIKRYDTYVEKRIDGVRMYIVSLRDVMERMRFFIDPLLSIEQQLKDANREMSFLTHHGQFFFTKLYPEKIISKIEGLSTQIDMFNKAYKELIMEWEKEYSLKLRNEGLIFEIILGNIPEFSDRQKEEIDQINPQLAFKIADNIQKNKAEAVKDAKNLRKELLKELYEIEKELDNFLQAN